MAIRKEDIEFDTVAELLEYEKEKRRFHMAKTIQEVEKETTPRQTKETKTWHKHNWTRAEEKQLREIRTIPHGRKMKTLKKFAKEIGVSPHAAEVRMYKLGKHKKHKDSTTVERHREIANKIGAIMKTLKDVPANERRRKAWLIYKFQKQKSI
jgi:hypothetical protein